MPLYSATLSIACCSYIVFKKMKVMPAGAQKDWMWKNRLPSAAANFLPYGKFCAMGIESFDIDKPPMPSEPFQTAFFSSGSADTVRTLGHHRTYIKRAV